MFSRMKCFVYTLVALTCSFVLRAQSEGKLVPILTGFSQPTDLTCPFDGTDRLFVTEKAGRIRIIRDDAMIGTFLDIRHKVSSNSERGLLGMAFHPNYKENGHVYVSYTGLGPDSDFNSYISRFTVSSTDQNLLDETSELEILRVNQPYANHNGGTIKFGPDGYLYIGLGDGGSGGDPEGSGQKLNSLLGAILRIDVDKSSDSTGYAIPLDNPFVNLDNVRHEIWAYGLRNPWKFSFDFTTGDMWIGDVGQSDREEVSIIPAGQGGLNFGWNCFEGELGFRTCNEIQHAVPYYTYARPDKNACNDPNFCGKSITGGFVYRGTENPALVGKYFFADYASNQVWSLSPDDKRVERLIDIAGVRRISSFGESESGELYVVSLNGSIYKLEQISTTAVNAMEMQFVVSPNPFQDDLKIGLSAPGMLSLSDIQGKVLRKMVLPNSENTIRMNVSDLAPGIYFLRFLNGDNLYFKSVIKS